MDLVGVETSSWRSERKNILQPHCVRAQANKLTNTHQQNTKSNSLPAKQKKLIIN